MNIMINDWILGHWTNWTNLIVGAIDSVRACGKLVLKLQSNNFLTVEHLEKSFQSMGIIEKIAD